jgi:hypothetical protein
MAQSSVDFQIDTPETIAAKIRNSKDATIYVAGLGVTTFDIKTGNVSVESKKVSGVTESFDAAATKKIDALVNMVKDGISLIAKTELLRQLSTLGDSKILKKVKANNIHFENPNQLTLEIIDTTLRQIQRTGSGVGFFAEQPSPYQKVAASAIGKIEDITCMDKVKSIMDSIQSQQGKAPIPGNS